MTDCKYFNHILYVNDFVSQDTRISAVLQVELMKTRYESWKKTQIFVDSIIVYCTTSCVKHT